MVVLIGTGDDGLVGVVVRCPGSADHDLEVGVLIGRGEDGLVVVVVRLPGWGSDYREPVVVMVWGGGAALRGLIDAVLCGVISGPVL